MRSCGVCVWLCGASLLSSRRGWRRRECAFEWLVKKIMFPGRPPAVSPRQHELMYNRISPRTWRWFH
eukprot:m.468908 g.468908  ORF g.468908 m.468908 type:complete len:67 (+) comp27930_c0_seq1:155-355(+)